MESSKLTNAATYFDPITQKQYATWILDESAVQARVRFKTDRPAGFDEELWLPRLYVKKSRAAGDHDADVE